ncbi:serine--tRNA ligase, partial [archaeon]|nr:serine--tRNA ligase [archaeon]
MLDINIFRTNPGIIKESQEKRGFPENDVDGVIELDKSWKQLKTEIDILRSKRNKISEDINKAKKEGRDIKGLLKEAQEIPKKLEEKEHLMNEKKKARDSLVMNIPNIIDKSVPVGDASKNKVLRKHGKIPKFKFPIKDHASLLELLGLLDTKKAGEVAGARFYYLKGDLARLNYAIICFALDFLRKKGFTLMQPPYMLRRDVLAGAIPFVAFEEMIYKIQDEDLYLIGTAEHAINAYCSNEIIKAEELPLRFAGISSCFRKEAGAHGKDTKGIFRIHQFEKVEQFVFCRPEHAEKEFGLMQKNSEEMYKMLGIPFRAVVLSSEETGRVASKTIDLEAWFPSQNAYRELGSCSNCLDYQARRS